MNYWKHISNFWDSFKERGLFESIWDSFQVALDNLRLYLFQVNLEKGIEEASPGSVIKWASLMLSDSNLVDGTTEDFKIVEEGTASIPVLQDRIQNPLNVYKQDIDYQINDGVLKWIGSSDIPKDVMLWAEKAYIYDKSISMTYGVLVGEDAVDSDEYLRLVKGMMHSYWMGPEIRHIRNGINIILGGPYCIEGGTVSRVDGNFMDIVSDSGIKTYEKSSNEWIWSEGDEVSRFDLLTNTCRVMDYIRDPSWWDLYGLSIYQSESVILTGDRNELNHIAKRFIWGVEYSSNTPPEIQASIYKFVTEINPSFAYHYVIIQNDFWGNDGDELDITDENIPTDPTDPNSPTLDYPVLTRTFDASQTITFNEISNLVYSDFESSNLGYEEYHTQDYTQYDVDNESLWFDDQLTIERI